MGLSFSGLKADPTKVVRTSPGATLVDLGDDVLGLELHGPKQAIGEDYLTMARFAAEETRRSWRGLVVSASAKNFCVGANLGLMLAEAQRANWTALDSFANDVQTINMQLKYLERPVIVAPYGFTIGGGAELAMHCARTVAAAESYLGLVETSVGLIPAAGGSKEMVVRSSVRADSDVPRAPHAPTFVSSLSQAFETVATAKTSGSAVDARDLGYLRPDDLIVADRDDLLAQAKSVVIEFDLRGYRAPVPQPVQVAGSEGRNAMEQVSHRLREAGTATAYDLVIFERLAYVLTGGSLPAGSFVREQHFLDLEREAFLTLCGYQESRDRMQHLLSTNRPLRN